MSANQVSATTRTSLIWIASAPASRSSWTVSRTIGASTLSCGSLMVSTMPGPVAGTVPARMPSAASRSRAARCASASLLDWLLSRSREDCSPRISSDSRSPSRSTPAKMRTSSSSRRLSRPSSEVWRTWTMIAKPRRPASSIASTLARVARGAPARHRRCQARAGVSAGLGPPGVCGSEGSGACGPSKRKGPGTGAPVGCCSGGGCSEGCRSGGCCSVMRRTGAGGSQRRWRRCARRARRPHRWRAGCRRRACRRGTR